MESPPYQLVRPDHDLALRGLHVLVGGPESSLHGAPINAETRDKVDGFLAYAQSIQLDITRQVLVIEPPSAPLPQSPSLSPGRILSMCLWVPSPGRTAMLFAPSLSDFPHAAPATEAAIAAAVEDARNGGVLLVQAMMEPADAAGKTVFAAAGLTQLATLTYMERRPPFNPPVFALPAGYTLAPYDASTHDAFRRAILASYRDTPDCPAMAGLRDVDDVLEGHKGVGQFDPQLWGVLLRDGEPVGCLLLAEIAARRALELVYLGLAPEARGQGIGRTLMQRMLAISSRRHFALATLAVDAANAPAVKLYRRCGFTSVAQRVALIKRL